MKYIRIAVNVLLIFLFLKFFSEVTWLTWILIFLVSDLSDSVSTSIAVALSEWGWAIASNDWIQKWGSRIGFNAANYLHFVITFLAVFVLSYLIGFLLPATVNFILFWLSVDKFEAVVHNLIFAATGIETRSFIYSTPGEL